MDMRLTFNENPENYDQWRPTYCEELFNDIINYAGLNETKKAIEIGIGTGQATTPFLKTGCKVTAVELGKDLAEYSKEKFKDYENFNICNTSFEDFKCDENSVDLLYSATAFHWIPDDVGYPKVLKMLKDNGAIAVFWNKPFIVREDDPLHQKIRKIYSKYRPSNIKFVEHDEERYKKISETIKSYGFRDVEVKLYHQTRKISSDGYIALLNTYSDHITLEPSIKRKMEDEIRNAIVDSGDILNVYDTIDLYLGRK